MDDLEFDDARTGLVLSCLSLGDVAGSDRTTVGLRVAAKLDAVLQHLNIDLVTVPDSWRAEPQTFGKETVWQVTVALQSDGTWRFDSDTIAGVPEMFDKLTPAEKSRKDRESRFGSARQTMRTFLRAASRGDEALAARAIDLSMISMRLALRDRADAGSQAEIRDRPDWTGSPSGDSQRCGGPASRFLSRSPGTDLAGAHGHRSDQGRMAVHRRDHEPDRTDVPHRAGPAAALTSNQSASSTDPLTVASIGILLRQKLPRWVQMPVSGLDLYQWAGLAGIVLVAIAVAWTVFRILNRFVRLFLHRARFDLSDEFVPAPSCGLSRGSSPCFWQSCSFRPWTSRSRSGEESCRS